MNNEEILMLVTKKIEEKILPINEALEKLKYDLDSRDRFGRAKKSKENIERDDSGRRV